MGKKQIKKYIGLSEDGELAARNEHHIVMQSASHQGVLSWRASGDRQISLSASDERAFANFRVKNVVFTGTHFFAVLSMVGEHAFANFCGKNIVFYKYTFLCFHRWETLPAG